MYKDLMVSSKRCIASVYLILIQSVEVFIYAEDQSATYTFSIIIFTREPAANL